MTTMKFSEIRISKNVRRALGDISALADDITKRGLDDPLWIRPDGELLRGHRRHAALKIIRSLAESNGVSPLPFEDVPVEIKENFTDVDRIYAQLTDREGIRKNLTPWESCCALYDLRKTGLSCRDISERVNISESDVYKKVNIREVASKEVMVLLDRGLEVPLVVLHSFIRISEEQQVIEVRKCFEPGKRPKRGNPGKKANQDLIKECTVSGDTVLRRAVKLSEEIKTNFPENKLAIRICRYILGQTNNRPVTR